MKPDPAVFAKGMFFVGIDPGKSGGIVAMTHDGGIHPELLWKMPESEHELHDIFRYYLDGQTSHAILERAQSMPKQGVSSSFNFGVSYGFLRGLLIAFRIPFEIVQATTWQRYMHCLTHGDKNISKARALNLFPHLPITHATADALLLAKYGREKSLGLLPPPIKIVRQSKPDPRQARIPLSGQEQIDDF